MWNYDQQQQQHHLRQFSMSQSINGAGGAQPRLSKSAPCSPLKPLLPQNQLKKAPARADSFHVIHKVPVGDTPYVKAKHVQLVDKDPDRAIALFWAAINAGDRVDSALKDMAIVMKQQNRAEEAIEAIKSLRCRCSENAQESLDNVLLDLYKRCGRLDDQIALLKHKLHLIHQGLAFNGRRTKTARCQGKKFQVSIEQEATRLLGNLGWAYMQQSNFGSAEAVYRKALSIEADNNKVCNLGICLMKQGKLKQAKALLTSVKPANADSQWGSDSHLKSYERAQQMLKELIVEEEGGVETTTQAQRRTQTSSAFSITPPSLLLHHDPAAPEAIDAWSSACSEPGAVFRTTASAWRSNNNNNNNPLTDSSDLSGALFATAGFGPSLPSAAASHLPPPPPPPPPPHQNGLSKHRRANSYCNSTLRRWDENDALQGFADENSIINHGSSSSVSEALRKALEAMALSGSSNNASSSLLNSAAPPFVAKSAAQPFSPSPARTEQKRLPLTKPRVPLTLDTANHQPKAQIGKAGNSSKNGSGNRRIIKSLFPGAMEEKGLKEEESGMEEWSRLGFIQNECSSPLCTIASITAEKQHQQVQESQRRLQVFQEMTTTALPLCLPAMLA